VTIRVDVFRSEVKTTRQPRLPVRLQVGSSRLQALVDRVEMPRSQRIIVVPAQTVLGTEALVEATLVAQHGIEIDANANAMQGKSRKSPLVLFPRARREAFEVGSFRPHKDHVVTFVSCVNPEVASCPWCK